MSTSTADLRQSPGAGVLDPFNIAGYIAWATVVVDPATHYLLGTPWPAPYPALALTSIFLTLGLFVARAILDARWVEETPQRAVILAQAVTVLFACWASQNELTPVLMVVVASQIAAVFPPRRTFLLLLLINSILALLLRGLDYFVLLVIAYAGFQAFAAVVTAYACKIDDAREEAVRINAELLATRQLLEEGSRADERLRLSRELHDLVGHKLTALKMQLSLRRRQTPTQDSGFLENCEQLADELLTDIRGVVSALRSHEGVDLQAALYALDPKLPRPQLRFELDRKVRVDDMRSAEVLLRCAQEGLTNALRHSAASLITMRLSQTGDEIQLEVEDNGKGRATQLQPGNGLSGLRERLEEAGGQLQLSSNTPTGILLLARLHKAQSSPVTVRESSSEKHGCLMHRLKNAEDRAGG